MTQPRKVVISAVGARSGGGLRHLDGLIERLGRAHEELTFSVLVDREIRQQLGPAPHEGVVIEETDVGSSLRRLVWDQWDLPRLARRWAADGIVSLLNHGPRFAGMPHVIYQRNAWYVDDTQLSTLSLRERVDLALRRRAALASCRGASLVLTPSHAMRTALAERLPRAEIQVLPHSTDTEFFSPSAKHLETLPARLAAAGSPRLVYVSHVAPHKGHEELIEAFFKVLDAHPETTLALTVAAGGSRHHGASDRIARLIGSAEASPNVHFVGAQGVEGVRALYEWADIVLFPSRLESFGIPVLEAMAMAKPVIASDLACLKELGGETVVYHRVGDAHSLAHEIGRLASDGEGRANLGKRARERSLNYDWDKYIPTFMGYVRRVVSS